jgi:hypothetical protein
MIYKNMRGKKKSNDKEKLNQALWQKLRVKLTQLLFSFVNLNVEVKAEVFSFIKKLNHFDNHLTKKEKKVRKKWIHFLK